MNFVLSVFLTLLTGQSVQIPGCCPIANALVRNTIPNLASRMNPPAINTKEVS